MKQILNDILNYLELDLNNIPKEIESNKDMGIKSSELKAMNNYKVYKYIDIKDIEILVTNAHRLDEPSKKMETINTLDYYLNKKHKEEYNEIITLLENASIQEIEDIEKEQENFQYKIPQAIKYNKDYLWQIFYSQTSKKYYMVVHLQETKQQTFLYLLKHKVQKTNKKIYVPICNLTYEDKKLNVSTINQLEDILNYFTETWPITYEYVDKEGKSLICIIGAIDVLDNVKSDYKLEFNCKEDIINTYNLLNVLYLLQMELSNYYKFDIIVDKTGFLHFYYNNEELTNETICKFYKSEIDNALKNINDIEKMKKILLKKLNTLKKEEKNLYEELSYKQKQISIFLECKKSFIGKIKFFLKKSKNKTITKKNENVIEDKQINEKQEDTSLELLNYDVDDLIYVCKKLQETTMATANIRMDTKNLALKIDILKKKNENASLYLNEIETHKKNIFDFWKFTNKDEQKQLTEAQTCEPENKNKIQKAFSFKEDFNRFSKQIDLFQRDTLDEKEINSVLVSSTKILNDINLLSSSGKLTSENYEKNKDILSNIDINYNLLEHREKPRNINNIIDAKNISFNNYEEKIRMFLDNLNSVFKKNKTQNNIVSYSLYKPNTQFHKTDLNSNNLINLSDDEAITLYKLNIKSRNSLCGIYKYYIF